MNILIATGIYPPALGGPAQYAENLKNEWAKKGYGVKVKTYRLEHKLPSGVRHFHYFLKIIPAVIWSDFIYALDTMSVGWPATLAARLFRRKIIMRTGGDFLWEGYTERTRKPVLLRDFYTTPHDTWSKKEKLIFKLTKWTLHHVDVLIFSTKWQTDIWMSPYDLAHVDIRIVENYYGKKEQSFEPTQKDFIAGARPLVWKNIQILKEVFASQDIMSTGAIYRKETYPYHEYMDRIAHAYATLLVSLGDISPNMILDTIRHNKPFIMTKENGLMDRIQDIAIIVDPKDPKDIREKILRLCKKENYDVQVQKVQNFNFTHTWEEIAGEIVGIYEGIKNK